MAAVESSSQEARTEAVAPRMHSLLCLVSVLPLLVSANVFPTNVNIILTATLTVYVGSRRSVKPTPPEESMTRNVGGGASSATKNAVLYLHEIFSCVTALRSYVGGLLQIIPRRIVWLRMQDALRFPLYGSAVLVGLFVLFKFLPKDLVNAILAAYFVVLGTVAITATILPFAELLFPGSQRATEFNFKVPKIPFITQATPFSPPGCC
jgi:minor histocompatibility antigen H13